MRMVGQRVLVLAVAALMAAPALAQNQQRQRGGRGAGGGAGFGQLGLLMNKDVQQDLKLSEDQVKAITAASTKQREAAQGLRDLQGQERRTKMQEVTAATNKTIDSTLKADQKKRLQQLTLQQQGVAGAANNPEVAKTLNITDEQKQKIQDLNAANREKFREIFQNAAGDREAATKKMAELRKETNTKIEGVLTADQKTKWKEMTGEPFKGTLPPGGFGGGAGRRPGGGRGAPPPGK